MIRTHRTRIAVHMIGYVSIPRDARLVLRWRRSRTLNIMNDSILSTNTAGMGFQVTDSNSAAARFQAPANFPRTQVPDRMPLEKVDKPEPSHRHAHLQEAAYYVYQHRLASGRPGDAVSDWNLAESLMK